jgi:dienelactone hydrolase
MKPFSQTQKWLPAVAACFIFSVLNLGVRAASDPSDPFLPYLDGKPPHIARDLGETDSGNSEVRLRQVVFRSRTIQTLKGSQPSLIYAVIARPRRAGKYPGLLILHGGRGAAEREKAVAWAARGYVVVAPDVPGIADPESVPHSSGAWKGDYTSKYIFADPDVTASPIFDGVLASVQALHLLRAQPDVMTDRIGVVGIAWGGYMTTMVCGLAGDAVRAAFSVYGSGFYDKGSAWEERLATLPENQKDAWLKYLDAGRRARSIKSDYFVAAATNHPYFWPPAVTATLAEIPGAKNQLFAPNAVTSIRFPGGGMLTNDPSPTWLDMEKAYFAYHLHGQGEPFPSVTIEKAVRRDGNTVRLRFLVRGQVASASAYYSVRGKSWTERRWVKTDVIPMGRGYYETVIPAEVAAQGADWLALASDSRPVTVSSLIEAIPNP